ncbi:MAG: hypothetical protein V7776_04980 [Halopseudomonas aestusnigri]
MKYVPPLNGDTGNVNRSWVDENVALGEEGSIPPGDAFEHPQREIVHVITESGLTPDGEDLTQLNQAIDAKIAAASGLSPYDIPFNAGLDADLVAEDLIIKHYGTMIMAREITPVSVIAELETAPTGSSVVFDVTADGVSIFSALPSFAADTGNYLAGTLVADVKLAKDSVIRFVVSAVGTTTPGAGLRIGIEGRV